MTEAFGELVFFGNRAITLLFSGLAENESASGIVSNSSDGNLLSHAGVKITPSERHSLVPMDDGEYLQEGIEIRNGICHVTVFGDEWMALSRIICERATDVGFCGFIDHENGTTEFYCLSHEGGKTIRTVFSVDEESDDVFELASQVWAPLVPNKVKEAFPEMTAQFLSSAG